MTSRDDFRKKAKQRTEKCVSDYEKNPKFCKHCGKKISFQSRRNTFCNHTCSASFSNRIRIFRRPLLEKFCRRCGNRIERDSFRDIGTLCSSCRALYFTRYDDNIPLNDIIYTQLHKSSAFALVRSRARTVIKSLNITKCQKCGYSKHVEVCHRKPISSYPLDTLVSVINAESNLLVLCPNCHWEFDHII